jgi:hypothetical protein
MANPKILTVRHPWAWAIIHGGKDIENRSWVPTGGYRGPVIIHAGRALDREDYDLVAKLCTSDVPEHDLFWENRGKIIGMVNVVDCVQEHSSPWAEGGSWHWVLEDPVPAKHSLFVRGQLGLKPPPEDWRRAF